jgi:hypothetical protein
MDGLPLDDGALSSLEAGEGVEDETAQDVRACCRMPLVGEGRRHRVDAREHLGVEANADVVGRRHPRYCTLGLPSVPRGFTPSTTPPLPRPAI